MTKTKYRQLLNQSIRAKRWNENSTVRQLVCMPREKFRMYLESQFTDEMTWDNFGTYWYLKFRTPLKTAKDEYQLITLFHYSNIYPHEIIRAKENPVRLPNREDNNIK